MISRRLFSPRVGLLSLCLWLTLLKRVQPPWQPGKPADADSAGHHDYPGGQPYGHHDASDAAMPATQTTCRRIGQARAAVMRALVLGPNQNLGLHLQ